MNYLQMPYSVELIPKLRDALPNSDVLRLYKMYENAAIQLQCVQSQSAIRTFHWPDPAKKHYCELCTNV